VSQPVNILVVDDDASIRQLLVAMLVVEGYAVHAVADGVAALESVESARPDCIVLDVMMPGIDGHDVLAQVRSRPVYADIPVVMLSAAAEDRHAWRAWSEGVDYFLAKPFAPEQLLRYLDYLFAAVPAWKAPAGCP
jgi:CheY-like chemotaxis protein